MADYRHYRSTGSLDGEIHSRGKEEAREVHHVRQRSMHIIGVDSAAEKQRNRQKQKRRRRREISLERSAPSAALSPALGSRDDSLRSSRSVGNLFQKTFSLRHSKRTYTSSELSTVDSAPGVVKVFGESISPGATYKSVLAVPTSSAQELVKEALDRYSISRRKAQHYVLCDVIGKFIINGEAVPTDSFRPTSRKGVWTEECIRIIGDNEKPLVLQSFWKPAEGYLRRFELRKRSQLLAMENIDTTTSGINANARRMLLTKARSPAVPDELQAVQKDADRNKVHMHKKHKSELHVPRQRNGANVVEGVKEPMAPKDKCYLLTIAGFNPSEDSLVHPLKKATVHIGSNPRNTDQQIVILNAPDIVQQHCILHRMEDKHGRPTQSWSLNTVSEAHVAINGCVVKSTVPLHSGDLIAIGQHYIFVYKDPNDEQQCASAISMNFAKQHIRDQSVIAQKHMPPPPPAIRLSSPLEELQKVVSQRYDDDQESMKLTFHAHRELELLNKVCNTTANDPTAYVLAPAYLLSLGIEHSSAKHGQLQAKSFLLKVASHLQTSVWNCTRRMSDQASTASKRDAIEAIVDIKQTLVWLSNGLEIHHYVKQQHLRDSPLINYMHTLPEDTRSSIIAADREVSAVLDEVIIQCFQQTVYQTSKIMHEVMVVIIDTNPFQDTQHGIDRVIQVLSLFLSALQEKLIHPKVINQFFCYIFFFISNSLFNAVMNHGDRYMNWSKGVQIRGNLDILEQWASDHGLTDEAQQYLVKLTSLANLLSTPKRHMQKLCLDGLTADYPEFNKSQLIHILRNYQAELAENLAMDLSTSESAAHEIHEGFSSHPPLVIPKDGFQLNLKAQNLDKSFYGLLRTYNAEFKKKEDDADSGLGVSPGQGNRTAKAESSVRGIQNRVHSSFSKEGDYEDINQLAMDCDRGEPSGGQAEGWTTQAAVSSSSREQPLYASVNKDRRVKQPMAPRDHVTSIRVPQETQNFIAQTNCVSTHSANGPGLMHPQVVNVDHVSSHAVDSVLLTQKLNEIKQLEQTKLAMQAYDEPIYFNVPFVALNCPDFDETRRGQERISRGSNCSTLAHGGSDQSDTVPVPPKKIPPKVAPKPKKNRPKVPPLDFSKLHRYEDEFDDDHCDHSDRQRRSGVVNETGDTTCSSLLATIDSQQEADSSDDEERAGEGLGMAELTMTSEGLGLGIMDANFTSLREPGIYVRTLVPGGEAERNGTLRLGDRLLSVNGTNIIDADYSRAMKLIKRVKESGKVQFLYSRSNKTTISKIVGTPC